jgi:hypothetical protein
MEDWLYPGNTDTVSRPTEINESQVSHGRREVTSMERSKTKMNSGLRIGNICVIDTETEKKHKCKCARM